MGQVYDVVIIGAGPAGCAAALTLTKAGLSVALFDKAIFPRDKTCGDALIPDARHALEKLGLSRRVVELSCPTHGMRLISRDGSDVLIRAHSACLPRLKLDGLLLESAIEAGARFLPGHDFIGVLDENEETYRVEFNRGNEIVAARARWVLLATGAHSLPIERAGLLLRAECRSFAVRQYVRSERLAKDFNELVFVFDNTIKGGYGWIFPGPDAVFNIGIGFFGSAHKHNNPRRNYEQFIAKLPLAQELMRDGEIVSPLKGAPLRTGLSGTRFATGGLLGIGECVGATFPLTGEGIGKAMETGILAAEAIIAKQYAGRTAVERAYTRSMDALQPKFEVYRKAEFLFNWPYLTNKLVTHTAKNETMRRKMEELFNETSDPGFLLTLTGWKKILFH
jgi:menaquinone-9 beta-reductase